MAHKQHKVTVYPVLLLREWDPVLAANGSAYPMGCLVSYAKAYKQGILQEGFDIKPLINRQELEWGYYLREAEMNPAAIWLFSSYVWNHDDNMQLAKAIKQRSPQSLIIMGGPHIPAYQEENRVFLTQHPYVDITARGEGEVTLAEILEVIQNSPSTSLHTDFSSVAGIVFRKNNDLVRTVDRIRSRTLENFPSPYLTGEFNHESFNNLPIMVLETNRGCPFGCTFCDWGSATLQKFSLFEMNRVLKEMDIIARMQPGSVYLADSNFGAFERDIEITKVCAESKKKYGYPITFGSSFAKNASNRLAEIIKILSSAKMLTVGLISIQSTDEATLTAINRSNIRNEKYEKLIEIFKSEKLNLSSELLIGLPGQTVKSHKEDLQFFIDRKLMTVAYNTLVMPNAPMNDPEYREKYHIVTNKDGYVLSTSTFSAQQREEMFALFMAFQFFYGLGVIKYILYYMQMDHSIRAMDFISDLLKAALENNKMYPLNYRIQKELLVMRLEWSPTLEWKSQEADFLFDEPDEYYSEVMRFIKNSYSVTLKPSVEKTLLTAQKAIMPAYGKAVPFSVGLEHDLCAYMQQIKKATSAGIKPEGFKCLETFPEGILKVSALKNKVITDLALSKYDRYTGSGWELKSALRF